MRDSQQPQNTVSDMEQLNGTGEIERDSYAATIGDSERQPATIGDIERHV